MGSTNSFDLNNPRNTDDFTDEEIYAFGLEEAVGVYRRENPDEPAITEEEVPQHFSHDEIMSYGTQVAWNKLWRNICVSDTFEPGSTQKPFTVAGVIEEGIDKPTDSFNCTGNVKLSDGVNTWQINCVNRNGHGWLDMAGALRRSCNPYFINLGLHVGGQAIYNMAYAMGSFCRLCRLSQPFSFWAKSARISEILICWGHTASQLRQPRQAEGRLSSGRVWTTMGAMKPPPVKECSL